MTTPSKADAVKEARLTSAQRELLECCLDWSAPFEVAARRRALGRVVFSRSTRIFLERMLEAGMVEYGRPNDTYRITPAGRAILSGDSSP